MSPAQSWCKGGGGKANPKLHESCLPLSANLGPWPWVAVVPLGDSAPASSSPSLK